MEKWTEICRLDDIPPLGARILAKEGGNIALFRAAGDAVYALEDKCPHKGGPLSQGIVHGDRVACPLHNWVLELQSGEAVAPDVGCATAYPVRLENGVVHISLPAKAAGTVRLERVRADREQFDGSGPVHSGRRGAQRDAEPSGKRRNASEGPIRPTFGRVL